MNIIETPWGTADNAVPYADGVTFYETPSHGGFHLSPYRLAMMPSSWHTPDRFYEEDCEWSVVALSFPTLFKPHQVIEARKMYDSYYPDGFKPIRRGTCWVEP
jgi:hypothetical protein